TPAAKSSRSVRVVLPASTCAKIPRFKVLTARHVLWIRGDTPPGGHERCGHFLLLGRSAVVVRVQHMAALQGNRFVAAQAAVRSSRRARNSGLRSTARAAFSTWLGRSRGEATAAAPAP